MTVLPIVPVAYTDFCEFSLCNFILSCLFIYVLQCLCFLLSCHADDDDF